MQLTLYDKRFTMHVLVSVFRSSYGDALFLVLQTWVIAALILHYNGNSVASAVYSAVFAAVLAFLMSPGAPSQVVYYLYASNMPNVLLGRVSLCE